MVTHEWRVTFSAVLVFPIACEAALQTLLALQAACVLPLGWAGCTLLLLFHCQNPQGPWITTASQRQSGNHQGVSTCNRGWFCLFCPKAHPTNVTNTLQPHNHHPSSPRTLHCCNAHKGPISRCPQLPPVPQTVCWMGAAGALGSPCMMGECWAP